MRKTFYMNWVQFNLTVNGQTNQNCNYQNTIIRNKYTVFCFVF